MSFRDLTTLSLVATSGMKEKDISHESNCISLPKQIRLLRSAVIFGANASGKSNLIKGLVAFWRLVTFSKDISSGQPLPSEMTPFVLQVEKHSEPILLELVFYTDSKFFRYGFQVQGNEIIKEWLYTTVTRESLVFERNKLDFKITSKYDILKDMVAKQMIPPNALLIGKAALLNDPTANTIFAWLSQFAILSGIHDFAYSGFSIQWLENEETKKQQIVELMQAADFGISDVFVDKKEVESIGTTFDLLGKLPPKQEKKKDVLKTVMMRHKAFNKEGQEAGHVDFLMENVESQGTIKFFHLSGPILDTLSKGSVLVIDELDTKLHPALTQRLVTLFHSPKTNPKGAQLVFATHDTNLLSAKVFRRDQIWFTEKDRLGASHLYALTDYKKNKTVRNDAALEKQYMEGRFGAIPFMDELDAILETKGD